MPLSENHTPIQSPDSRRRARLRAATPRTAFGAGRRTRFLRRSDRPLPRYAGPPRDTARALRSQLAMQSSRRATPRDRIRGRLSEYRGSSGRFKRLPVWLEISFLVSAASCC
jgi:hypothetical protein